jgi:selenide,water dikinase
MAPGDLQEVLETLRAIAPSDGDLLVGLGRADDAAVYRVSDEMAIVQTVDFFPPVVDDPYTWGAVAAANAMSDVYAMGGEVLFALVVAGLPRELPKSVIAEVFRGGAAKVGEAGGVIAGGHTVVDAEPKYGLCVTGRVHPDRLFIKGALRPGDHLFLSKRLGTGVVTTAVKEGAADATIVAGAVDSMLRLNRAAAAAARDLGVTAATDITGFGVLGHLLEMTEASGVGAHLDGTALPWLPGAQGLAEQGHWSGGMKRNRRHVDAVLGSRLAIDPGVPAVVESLLTESETSGGLLFAVRPERAMGVAETCHRHGAECWEIGEVLDGREVRITVDGAAT